MCGGVSFLHLELDTFLHKRFILDYPFRSLTIACDGVRDLSGLVAGLGYLIGRRVPKAIGAYNGDRPYDYDVTTV